MLKNYSKIEISHHSTKRYVNDERKLHRLDGPAVEHYNGVKQWFINDKRHRNIDPSSEWSDGEKYWWFKGKRHRVGGSFAPYRKCWCIHGKEYTKKEYYNIVWKI